MISNICIFELLMHLDILASVFDFQIDHHKFLIGFLSSSNSSFHCFSCLSQLPASVNRQIIQLLFVFMPLGLPYLGKESSQSLLCDGVCQCWLEKNFPSYPSTPLLRGNYLAIFWCIFPGLLLCIEIYKISFFAPEIVHINSIIPQLFFLLTMFSKSIQVNRCKITLLFLTTAESLIKCA